ncbi:tRNA-intron lyase [Entamoeba marina]
MSSTEHITLTNGLKFGVDHLGYLSDIQTTHSDYIVNITKSPSTVTMRDIIQIGRVAANTNKVGVIIDENGKGILVNWKMRDKVD